MIFEYWAVLKFFMNFDRSSEISALYSVLSALSLFIQHSGREIFTEIAENSFFVLKLTTSSFLSAIGEALASP
jgi:hypothetical protein